MLSLGCGPGPKVGEPVDPEPPVEATFSSISEGILQRTCAVSGCHVGDPPPRAPMSLESGRAYGALVGVASMQAPRLMRIAPGDPEKSYLLYKLRGSASSVGGIATRMPLGRQALPEQEISAIQEWIAKGAPDD
ncbi:MAG: hypothetical protein HYZ28_05570 [Myxococcales bacterium]|nr:hypothetical protein [Myxococcales bacterium]